MSGLSSPFLIKEALKEAYDIGVWTFSWNEEEAVASSRKDKKSRKSVDTVSTELVDAFIGNAFICIKGIEEFQDVLDDCYA